MGIKLGPAPDLAFQTTLTPDDDLDYLTRITDGFALELVGPTEPAAIQALANRKPLNFLQRFQAGNRRIKRAMVGEFREWIKAFKQIDFPASLTACCALLESWSLQNANSEFEYAHERYHHHSTLVRAGTSAALLFWLHVMVVMQPAIVIGRTLMGIGSGFLWFMFGSETDE